MDKTYDFSGWATRNDVLCADGRTIRRDAFKDCDGVTVPLVWNHQHNEAGNILGHALLENRPEGVYSYGWFNDTEAGRNAKKLVQHGDICSLSIFANKLKQQGGNVLHGVIREVSLVLAGANPDAFIDSVIAHSEDADNVEAIIYTGEDISLEHAEEAPKAEEKQEETKEDAKMAEQKEKTVKEVFDEMTEEQKNVVYALIGEAVKQNGGEDDEDNEEEGENMKHNLFDSENTGNEEYLSHADMEAVLKDAKRYGSLREAAIAHGLEDINVVSHSITNVGYMFPDNKAVAKTPEWIKRDMGWVAKVMGAIHHTPFSRIKSMAADITADEARAKGYIKGNLKKEEVFSLLKRTTDPQTIYKKQKLDRDDVIDITDFDVVAWLKSEMRMMLEEEIARAILIGDGRLGSDNDKIDETHVRPVAKDAALYTVQSTLTNAPSAGSAFAKEFVRAAIKARKDYKGSGNPTLYTTEDVLTELLLLEDTTGRIIYESVEKLATVMRVKEIVTVPVMEGAKGADNHDLYGVIVNLADYNVGADKGGEVNLFDDFDIDYNAQKYLIETRCSGALVKPYAAIAFTSAT